jgi:hypothetical protein
MFDDGTPRNSMTSTLDREPRQMALIAGVKMAGLMVIISFIFALIHLASPEGQQMGILWKVRDAVNGFLFWAVFSSLVGGIAAAVTAGKCVCIDRIFFGALVGGIAGALLLATGCALDAAIPPSTDVKKFPPLDAGIFGAVVGGMTGCILGGVAGAADKSIGQNAMATFFFLICGFIVLLVVALILLGGLF